jgi:hypothetical protein
MRSTGCTPNSIGGGRSTTSTDMRVYNDEVHEPHRASVDLVDLVDLLRPTQTERTYGKGRI